MWSAKINASTAKYEVPDEVDPVVTLIWKRNSIVIWEEAELLGIALTVVDDHRCAANDAARRGSVPAEVGNHVLARPGIGTCARSRPGRSRCGSCRLCCGYIGA